MMFVVGSMQPTNDDSLRISTWKENCYSSVVSNARFMLPVRCAHQLSLCVSRLKNISKQNKIWLQNNFFFYVCLQCNISFCPYITYMGCYPTLFTNYILHYKCTTKTILIDLVAEKKIFNLFLSDRHIVSFKINKVKFHCRKYYSFSSTPIFFYSSNIR